MSTTEDQLRAAYQSAARTVHPGQLRPDVRSPGPVRTIPATGRRGRGWLAPLAAACTVTVIVAAAIVVPRVLTGSAASGAHRGGTTGAPASSPAAVPHPFLAVLTSRQELDIVSATTGKVTGRVLANTLPGAASKATLINVAAVDGKRFLLAAEPSLSSCSSTLLYTLTISAAGKPANVRPYIVTEVPGTLSFSGVGGMGSGQLAASADGSTVAYVAASCGPHTYASPGNETIGVIRDGQLRAWTENWLLGPASLSLTANGGVLGFVNLTQQSPAAWSGSAWTLSTKAAPGQAEQRGHRVFADVVFKYKKNGYSVSGGSQAVGEQLSPDGSTMYLLAASSPICCGWRAYAVTAYNTASGARLHTLHNWPHPTVSGGWITASGDEALVWGITLNSVYEVNLMTGATQPFGPLTKYIERSQSFSGAIAW